MDPEDGRHPLPEGPGGVDAQEAGCSGRERRQHHQVLGSGPVHQSALFRAPKLSKKRYLLKNTVKVSISTTGTVVKLDLDPDPHSEKMLDPDQDKMNVDPQPCPKRFY